MLLSIQVDSTKDKEVAKPDLKNPSRPDPNKYVEIFANAVNYARTTTHLDSDCCRLRDSKGRTYPLAPDNVQRAIASQAYVSIYSDDVGNESISEVYVFDVPKDATGYSIYLP